MRQRNVPPPALDAAIQEVQRSRRRGEVFLRLSETEQVRRDRSGNVDHRRSQEAGVACRVAGVDGRGFAAASGSGARSGHLAAASALAAIVPGPDPLPPRDLLGASAIPAAPARGAPEARAAFAAALTEAVATRRPAVGLVELRILEGRATSWLATAEGFVASCESAAATVELLLDPPEGPWRLVGTAAPALADLDPAALAERACEAALLACRGGTPRRQLADVVLAPAVAAALLAVLGRQLTLAVRREHEIDTEAPRRSRSRVSPLWNLADERIGPDGLMPSSFDGEGIAARRIELLAGGRPVERFAAWEDVAGTDLRPGAAVRASYREPPAAGPANLVLRADHPLPVPELLAALGHGFYLALPAGAPRVDERSGAFSLHAAAVAIEHGRAVAAHPLVEVRGSLRRLLTGLAAIGDDPQTASLACAVTTPSLLVKRLEIA